jgi:hypothetical protein
MAQPTFHRSGRSVRKARLRRTVLFALLGVGAVAFVVGRLSGGEPDDPKISKVAFTTTVVGDGSPKPARARAQAEAKAITALLDDYYQRAFVDPASFSDEHYPEVAERFQASARDAFAADTATLTIGEAARQATRVEPRTATADIVVFFDAGKPTLATAGVAFVADATLKDGGLPLRIEQRATLHLVKEGDTWRIAYYDHASQKQTTIEPSESPS